MSFPYHILKAELTGDPLARGYAGMTDAEAADSLNTPDITRNRRSMSGDEVFQATDATEFGTLTDAGKSQWLAFCGRETIHPAASANVGFVTDLFAGGATLAALATARQETISWAEALGLPPVLPAHVAAAKLFGS